ncbi:MAG: hypothetical protein K9W44_17550 [Candidatus Lokiarchaeota archaeon]|nr:hypothetical protein [Candidatus Harpocratesius repetitus]
MIKKYKFTRFQAILTGGFSLGLYEVILGGSSLNILMLLLWPFLIMIHGVHLIVPKILFFDEDKQNERKESNWKYVFGIILPVLGIGIGILVSGIIAQAFNLEFY